MKGWAAFVPPFLRVVCWLQCLLHCGLVSAASDDCVYPLEDRDRGCTASVNSKCYGQLQDAMNAATVNSTVLLWEDVMVMDSVVSGLVDQSLSAVSIVGCRENLSVACGFNTSTALKLPLLYADVLYGASLLNSISLENFAVRNCSKHAVELDAYNVVLRKMKFDRNGYGNRFTELAAVMLTAYDSASVTDCEFTNNGYAEADTADIGAMGALFSGQRTSGRLMSLQNHYFTNVLVRNNTGTYGGGFYLKNQNWTMTNCSFVNNRALYGGGIYAETMLHIVNSTFENNTAHGRTNDTVDSGHGGAAFFRMGTDIINSHFHNNSARSGGAVVNVVDGL